MDKNIIKNYHKQFLTRKNEIAVVTENENHMQNQLIFLFSVVVLPMIFSLILFIVKTSFPNFSFIVIHNINNYLVKLAIPMGGFLILIFKSFRYMIKSKLICFYLWAFIFPNINSSIYNTLSFLLTDTTSSEIYQLLTTLLFASIVIFLSFWQNFDLKMMWKKLVKDKFLIFFVSVVLSILFYYFVSYIISLIQNTIDSSISNNQNGINSSLNNTLGIIRIFITVVLIAPIIEEILYRYLFFTTLNFKFWNILITTLYFAFAHIQNSLDWLHFISYLPLGLTSALMYYYLLNIYPSIALHMVTNLISFCLII